MKRSARKTTTPANVSAEFHRSAAGASGEALPELLAKRSVPPAKPLATHDRPLKMRSIH